MALKAVAAEGEGIIPGAVQHRLRGAVKQHEQLKYAAGAKLFPAGKGKINSKQKDKKHSGANRLKQKGGKPVLRRPGDCVGHRVDPGQSPRR